MISKSWCPFCKKVKDVLKKHIKLDGDDVAVIEIENDKYCDAIQDEMKKMTGGRSVNECCYCCCQPLLV